MHRRQAALRNFHISKLFTPTAQLTRFYIHSPASAQNFYVAKHIKLLAESEIKDDICCHKPKTIFFTLKNYTYWKPYKEGTLRESSFFVFLIVPFLVKSEQQTQMGECIHLQAIERRTPFNRSITETKMLPQRQCGGVYITVHLSKQQLCLAAVGGWKL